MNAKKFTSKFEKSHGGREIYFPTKLKKDQIGDCAIRACAIATGRDYMETMKTLFDLGANLGNMPNSDEIVELFLRDNGFVKMKPFRNGNGLKYKVNTIPINKSSSYVVRVSQHLTAIVNGVNYDSWYCGEYSANSYYVKEN